VTLRTRAETRTAADDLEAVASRVAKFERPTDWGDNRGSWGKRLMFASWMTRMWSLGGVARRRLVWSVVLLAVVVAAVVVFVPRF
jgi:hypothetical protein